MAALEAMIALRKLANHRVSIELLSPERRFEHLPMLVGAPFGKGEAHEIDVARVAHEHDARHRLDALAEVQGLKHRAITHSGGEIGYDALVVAIGVRRLPGLADTLTLASREDAFAVKELVEQLGDVGKGSLAFVLPPGVTWMLPMYELALMTSLYLFRRSVGEVELSVVTTEDAPLATFGPNASKEVAGLLDEGGIAFHGNSYATGFANGTLSLGPKAELAVDHVVSAPLLEGPPLPGVPQDADGFIPVDLHGMVRGEDAVYAAGDITAFPVKQGGLAAQQADAVAEALAALAGAPVTPQPFKPDLRALLLTGERPRRMHAAIAGGRGDLSDAEPVALPGWPPVKIDARYLAPYLHGHGA